MTVIAVEDWITPVISVPASTPLIGVPAALARNSRILLTDSAWMPFAMNSRPSMKMPRPADDRHENVLEDIYFHLTASPRVPSPGDTGLGFSFDGY